MTLFGLNKLMQHALRATQPTLHSVQNKDDTYTVPEYDIKYMDKKPPNSA